MSELLESTAVADGGHDPGPELPETTSPDPGPTPAAPEGGASSSKEDTFFDASQLSPELQTQWKRMQGAYTKKMQAAADWRKKADAFDRFYGDRTYQQQVLESTARELGFTLNRAGQVVPAGPSRAATADPELMGALKESLGPELGFLADKLAPVFSSFLEHRLQAAVSPLQQRTESMTQAQLDARLDAALGELSEKVPGWEAYEDDMEDLLGFLQSGETHSRRWGNKAVLLFNMVNDGAATAKAVARIGQAGKNRVSTGHTGQSTATNWDEIIKKEKNPQKRWALLTRKAEADLTRQGISIPD